MHWETVLDDTGVGRVRVLHGFLSPQEAIWYFKHFAGSDYRVIRPGNPSLGEFEVDGVTFNRKCPRGTMHRGQKMCMEHGGVPGYGFSGITVETQTMAEEEVNLLKRMNEATSTDANALLLNYYRSDIIDLEQDPPKRYVDSLGAHSGFGTALKRNLRGKCGERFRIPRPIKSNEAWIHVRRIRFMLEGKRAEKREVTSGPDVSVDVFC
eukprot:GEMP01091609.1.p1 GENE.GEMP01091609.1~~GEMP01091609.1.p1  ORF type:complete len:217 (+),score=27.08 GEMP01091609.1:25-651(+)